MIVRQAAWDDPAGIALRTAQRTEIAERYQNPNSEPGPAPRAESITLFLVAFDDDGTTPIACGGLRQIDEHHGEVKRMFVVPDRRGSGVAALVLRSLEETARNKLGWDRLVLETGDRQPDAIRFYEREGYRRIPNFGHYAASEYSLCYELALSPRIGGALG
ncbi:MAG TPA: GNAT family N-acetyltransferase [Galbitalea sp.]|nr:GNAT family N-acetyltransferase [Galbitalea sp.]